MPTGTLVDLPANVDALIVPGGSTALNVARSPMVLTWLQEASARAQWVASVGSGSVLLGAAGLLHHRLATSHWLTRELLPTFGAQQGGQRVVIDSPFITAASATAGIDLALTLAALLRGGDYAAALELTAEYDPQPLRSPEHAGEALARLAREHFGSIVGVPDLRASG